MARRVGLEIQPDRFDSGTLHCLLYRIDKGLATLCLQFGVSSHARKVCRKETGKSASRRK